MTEQTRFDRRSYLKTLGAAATTAAIAGCAGGNDDGEEETETITPGTAAGFPPFEYTEDGELVGFDVDLAEAAIEAAGYEVGEWTDIEFDSLIPSLTEEDIDLIAAAMTITDERAEQIAFSDPYYEANQTVLVSEERDFQPEGESDLESRLVGVQSGTTGEGELDRLVEEGVVAEDDTRQYENYTNAVDDLENGNIDAIIVDTPTAADFTDERPVEVAFVIETDEEYGLGMRQDDDRIEDINAGLEEVRDGDTYDDLLAEYDLDVE